MGRVERRVAGELGLAVKSALWLLSPGTFQHLLNGLLSTWGQPLWLQPDGVCDLPGALGKSGLSWDTPSGSL